MKKQLSLLAGFLVVTSFSTTFSDQKNSSREKYEKYQTVYFTSDPGTGNSVMSFSKPEETSSTGIDLEQTSRILSVASLAVNSLDNKNGYLSQETKNKINAGIWSTKTGIGLGVLTTEDGKNHFVWNLGRVVIIGAIYGVTHAALGTGTDISPQNLQLIHAGTEAVFYALTALNTGCFTPLRDVKSKKAE